MDYGLAKGTQCNYNSSVGSFLTFCENERIDLALGYPADEYVLCAFVGSFTDSKSGSSAANVIAGLKVWHLLKGQPWHGGHLLAHVLHGSQVLTPASSRHPLRPAVTTAMLDLLHATLDHSNPMDAAIYAAALVAFWGQTHLGELIGTS
jgi:hypothetical protein